MSGPATVPTAVPAPTVLCTVHDPRLAELSGLVADDAGALWAMPDGGRRVAVYRIDPATCAVLGRRGASIDPYDPEDLARGPDGELWVGDIGDNDRARDTVAVVVLPRAGDPSMYRLTYPDGPHDAEALLVDAQRRPVIITKEPVGPAGIYRPAAPPAGDQPTPLVKVGEVTLPASDSTGGPAGDFGRTLVTGAAVSADGRVVALRTYTDAWLYRVPGGDVTAALAGAPVQVPLPGEPQGEGVAFDADGTLLSGSETRGGDRGQLRAVPGATVLATTGPAAVVPAASTPAAGPAAPASVAAWVAGGAAVAVLALGAGAMAVHGARRRR